MIAILRQVGIGGAGVVEHGSRNFVFMLTVGLEQARSVHLVVHCSRSFIHHDDGFLDAIIHSVAWPWSRSSVLMLRALEGQVLIV